MEKRRSIIGGIIMILVGVAFLLLNLFPAVAEQINFGRYWPLLIITVGIIFLLSALFHISDLAIPGSIITGIGGLLYYQNLSGNWASWAYVWTLIPGFVGVGLILSSLLSNQEEGQAAAGTRLILISAFLFFLFGFFFSGFGGLGQYWPIVLIILGVLLIIRSRFPKAS